MGNMDTERKIGELDYGPVQPIVEDLDLGPVGTIVGKDKGLDYGPVYSRTKVGKEKSWIMDQKEL